ncbi:PadR family transcriptional regulator [Streptomyces sp. NPDC001691]|uniref:PadR family transcriptional regulator n=1 Tax=Streptomyces sp. NPDC001691 TaxID=3364600 RepID=UPI00368BCBA7
MREVLAVIEEATAEAPAWGLTICQKTGRGPGSVYPALERLEEAGWIEGRWETPKPADRPPRRFYRATPNGQRGARKRQARWFALWRPSARTVTA